MNLKSLLQPTIEKIREESREEGREKERQENTKAMKLWLEEQIRAGNIPEDVDLPVFGDSGNGHRRTGENGKEKE